MTSNVKTTTFPPPPRQQTNEHGTSEGVPIVLLRGGAVLPPPLSLLSHYQIDSPCRNNRVLNLRRMLGIGSCLDHKQQDGSVNEKGREKDFMFRPLKDQNLL